MFNLQPQCLPTFHPQQSSAQLEARGLGQGSALGLDRSPAHLISARSFILSSLWFGSALAWSSTRLGLVKSVAFMVSFLGAKMLFLILLNIASSAVQNRRAGPATRGSGGRPPPAACRRPPRPGQPSSPAFVC